MCVCVLVCVWLCLCVYVSKHILHIYADTHMFVCISVYCIWMCVCMYGRVCACKYIFMHSDIRKVPLLLLFSLPLPHSTHDKHPMVSSVFLQVCRFYRLATILRHDLGPWYNSSRDADTHYPIPNHPNRNAVSQPQSGLHCVFTTHKRILFSFKTPYCFINAHIANFPILISSLNHHPLL